jgi:hypothetical protein
LEGDARPPVAGDIHNADQPHVLLLRHCLGYTLADHAVPVYRNADFRS